MSIELTVSSSQGRTAEWHDTIMPGGRRKAVTCPVNADAALAYRNEHWIGDVGTMDADKFNKIFQQAIDDFNARQTRPSRKMGPGSTAPARQKTYYEGIVDGTFCTGSGDLQEQAVYEAVLQIGNKDDNGTTDEKFSIDHWYELKQNGYEDKASEYALEHLRDDETTERTKRILRKTVDRIAAMDPEHLIVLRADYHGDEPCGTPNVHVAYTLAATGYKSGLEKRVASVRALAQMGFVKTRDSEYGITQLHERFKGIMEEEMAADAEEYGYGPIRRKAPSGEKRKRSDVDVYRDMAAQQTRIDEQDAIVTARIAMGNQRMADAAKREEELKRQEEVERAKAEQEARQKKLDAQRSGTHRMYGFVLDFLNALGDDRRKFSNFGELKDALDTAGTAYKQRVRAEASEAARQEIAEERALYAEARRICDSFIQSQPQQEIPCEYRDWAAKTRMAYRGPDGEPSVRTVAEWWQQHVAAVRQGAAWTPEEQTIITQADRGLGFGE